MKRYRYRPGDWLLWVAIPYAARIVLFG